MFRAGGFIFFFSDSSFLKYLDVLRPYCSDYSIEMRRGLVLLAIEEAD
jgi:hypothetical protein